MQEKFSKGDWIVHPNYGLGRIKKIERKRLDGEKLKYYRVEADETAFWIPLDGIEESRVRKIISSAEFRKAMKLLKKPPKKMDANFKTRRKRINEVVSEGLLRPTIRLIRDLWGRNKRKGLSDTEKNSLRKIMDNFVEEWALAEGISEEEAATELNRLLDQSMLADT